MRRLLLGAFLLGGLLSCAQQEPVFLECRLPNVVPKEFLIHVKERRVLNSQAFVDPDDGIKPPSFSIAEVNSDNLMLVREYQGLIKGKRGKVKELVYINRYNLRATDRLWLDDQFIAGGDGMCEIVEKKL